MLFDERDLAQLVAQAQAGNDEWYTPTPYVEAARRVLGGIDLDPASSPQANATVQAARYFTREDDGLAQSWRRPDGRASRVWLNPPFGRQNSAKNKAGGATGGRSIMGLFVAKLVEAYDAGDVSAAILLTTNKADVSWFFPLWRFPICFCKNRVLFDRPGRGDREGHFFGTIFVYLGSDKAAFIETFRQFGPVAQAVALPPRQTVGHISLWGDTL
jgi:hypothetical protein